MVAHNCFFLFVRTHVQVSAKSERSPGEPMKFVDLALNDPKALSFYAEE